MDQHEKNIWIVIAAYQEARVIRRVVEGVKRAAQQVVVVDDCSADATSAEAFGAGAIILRHAVNRGQGASLQTGTEFALQQGADIIIHFDADGQHQATDIRKFVDALGGGVDVALGSRFLGSVENMPFFKKITLRCGILFTWLFSGIKLTDTHNGFRALTRAAAKKIVIKEDRMAHASEILHDIAQYRLSYVEVPMTMRYTEHSLAKGQSSLNALSIVGRIVWRKLFLE